MQGSRLSSSWNFAPCVSFSKIPKHPFSISFNRKRVLFCLWVNFLCMPKIVQPILGVQISCKENIKIFYIFFLLLSFPLSFFLLSVDFSSRPGFFFFSSLRSRPSQRAHLLSGYSPGQTGTRGAFPTVGLIQRLGQVTFTPWPGSPPVSSLTAPATSTGSLPPWPGTRAI